MRFSMLYSGEQILSCKSCLIFYAEDSLSFSLKSKVSCIVIFLRLVSLQFCICRLESMYLLNAE